MHPGSVLMHVAILTTVDASSWSISIGSLLYLIGNGRQRHKRISSLSRLYACDVDLRLNLKSLLVQRQNDNSSSGSSSGNELRHAVF